MDKSYYTFSVSPIKIKMCKRLVFHLNTNPNRAQSQKHSYGGTHTFSPFSLSLFIYETQSSSKSKASNNNDVSYHNMFTAHFPTFTATLSGKRVSSPPRQVRFRLTVSFAIATCTEEQRHKTASYLGPHHGMASCAMLYEILGIRAAASGMEIKAAYRWLARMCHPDVAPMERKESSASEFMKIHVAYCTLLDPEKRASSDRSLFRRHQRPLTTTSSGGSSWIF